MEKSINRKLCKIQDDLNCPKSQFNNFGKYHYRSCEDIVEAVKKLAIVEECFLTISDKMSVVGNGRYYIEATAKLTCVNTNESIEVTAYAREAETKKGMDEAQITGSASSYARKYALNGLFAIDDTKDPDSTPREEPPKQPTPPEVEHSKDGDEKLFKKYELAFKDVKTLDNVKALFIEIYNNRGKLSKKQYESLETTKDYAKGMYT